MSKEHNHSGYVSYIGNCIIREEHGCNINNIAGILRKEVRYINDDINIAGGVMYKQQHCHSG